MIIVNKWHRRTLGLNSIFTSTDRRKVRYSIPLLPLTPITTSIPIASPPMTLPNSSTSPASKPKSTTLGSWRTSPTTSTLPKSKKHQIYTYKPVSMARGGSGVWQQTLTQSFQILISTKKQQIAGNPFLTWALNWDKLDQPCASRPKPIFWICSTPEYPSFTK